METALIVGIAWLVASVPAGILVGRRLRSRGSSTKKSNSLLSTLEISHKELQRKVASLEGSNLSLHRKFNKSLQDARKMSEPSENGEVSEDDLSHLTPADRALFER